LETLAREALALWNARNACVPFHCFGNPWANSAITPKCAPLASTVPKKRDDYRDNVIEQARINQERNMPKMVKLADKQEPGEPQGRLAQSWHAFARVMLTDEDAPPRLGHLCEICFFAGANVAIDHVVRGLAAGDHGVLDELIAESSEAQARIRRELLEFGDQEDQP
jgi:hypothetical protein